MEGLLVLALVVVVGFIGKSYMKKIYEQQKE